MVIVIHVAMMSDSARSFVLVFDESLTRIQTVSELLLISCIPRPVFTRPEDLAQTKDSFIRYRDKVIGQLNRMLILSRDIATQVHARQIQWKPFCLRSQELRTAVIHLSELSAHIAYLMAINSPSSEPAISGHVPSIYQLTQADLDIKFSCTRLKRSRMNDLHSHMLIDLCSTLTKSLTTMTDICRQAADKISDSNDQDQFKLCVKAITSTTGCLVSSIKSFKNSPSETHFRRILTFCDPVVSASGALLNFASEESFVSVPAILSADGLEVYKSILGLCMSIASANIQICRAVRDLVYSSSTKRQQDRISLCVESITRSSSQLRDLLLAHEFVPKPGTEQLSNMDATVDAQASQLSGFFDDSEEKDRDVSKVVVDKKECSGQTPRSSVEKELLISNEVLHQGDLSDIHGGHFQEINHRNIKSLPSAGDETTDPSMLSQAATDSNSTRSSPEHFPSSPFSISSSSSSLASSSSFNPEVELPGACNLGSVEHRGSELGSGNQKPHK